MTGISLKQVWRKINILAAVVRQVYTSKSKTLGVGTFKRLFGMKKRRGAHPPTFMKHSGKILRTIVKQLKTIV